MAKEKSSEKLKSGFVITSQIPLGSEVFLLNREYEVNNYKTQSVARYDAEKFAGKLRIFESARAAADYLKKHTDKPFEFGLGNGERVFGIYEFAGGKLAKNPDRVYKSIRGTLSEIVIDPSIRQGERDENEAQAGEDLERAAKWHIPKMEGDRKRIEKEMDELASYHLKKQEQYLDDLAAHHIEIVENNIGESYTARIEKELRMKEKKELEAKKEAGKLSALARQENGKLSALARQENGKLSALARRALTDINCPIPSPVAEPEKPEAPARQEIKPLEGIRFSNLI